MLTLRPRQIQALQDLRQAYNPSSLYTDSMAQAMDLSGQRFGRLTAVSIAFRRNGAYWLCSCDCGKDTVVRVGLLRNGTVASCGCGSREQARINCEKWWKRNERIPLEFRCQLKHCYQNMISRCTDQNNARWSCYGGRGIRVCDEWIGLDGRRRFYDWALEAGYAKGLQIDRINVNGNYSPDNCRFVDAVVQANNTRRNHVIKWNGQSLTLADWARQLGLTYSSMKHRIERGWSMERIASQPQRGGQRG